MNAPLRCIVLCSLFSSGLLFTSIAKESQPLTKGPKGNFILTAPRVIDAGSTAYFTLTVFDVPRGGTVTLRLTHKASNVPIAESQVEVYTNHNMWVEMNVPAMSSDVSAMLHVVGSFGNGYHIESFKEVEIRHNTLLVFVQTDKPLYKPGQTIRFRVLPMDNQLKPLGADTVGDVWIEDPAGIRVAQWKGVKFTEGIKQFDLPLSDEPPLGTWNIKTLIKQVTTFQTFKVQKYELPKFDVKIKLPNIIMADAANIPIEVCAKYTYGKTVEGTLKATVTYNRERYLAYSNTWRVIPSVGYQSHLSGCDVFEVNTDDLLMQTQEFGNSEMKVFAEVTENTTGIVRNATTIFKTSHQHVELEFLNDNIYYKPKLSYTGFLRAKKPDGSPASSEKVEICTVIRLTRGEPSKKKCQFFTTNKLGMVQFTIRSFSGPANIDVRATAINYEDVEYSAYLGRSLKIRKATASMTLHPWFSPSDNYLHIEPTTGEFECDKAQKVKVQYTAKKGQSIKFYHQVLSKGRIVQQGSHQRTFYSKIHDMQHDFDEDFFSENPSSGNATEVGEFVLTFDTKATMSPKARLLVFYIREDREVVADSRMFHITSCLQNKVSLDFRHEQQYPNTEAAMLLSASPSSLCGISMVDKSVRLLQDDTTFDKEKIFKVMDSYDIGKKSPYHRCFEGDEFMLRMTRRVSPRFMDFSADTAVAFEEAGMIVMTDLKLNFSKQCDFIPYGDSMGDYEDGQWPEPVMMMRSNNNWRPESGQQTRMEFDSDTEVKESKSNNDVVSPETEEIRSYFPETWLWELQNVGSSGETAITRQLPHTITEWVGNAVCVHPKTGLGISEAASVTTFQPFFIDFQLPYSVIRGERLTLIVTVFNYLSECLPYVNGEGMEIFKLEEISNKDIVNNGAAIVFSPAHHTKTRSKQVVSIPFQIKLSLEPSDEYVLLSAHRYQKVCVCGGRSGAGRFPIRTAALGTLNVTVYGFSMEQDDEVCGNEITARLSARDAVTKELLVEAEGFPKEEIFNYFICPESTNGSYSTEVPLLPPDDVIMDSARAIMTVTGDVMGPALNGLKKLVRLPVGCGEQNMVLFVPNIFVLDYLTSAGKITDGIREECLSHMKTGYQRELNYRHADGSYSAFGSRDEEGSLWLTAFVLRSFGQARRFIDIDEGDLATSRSWILESQLENGCFRPSGKVFQKEMKGGLKDSDQTLAPLTSYVLISLLESHAVETVQSSVVRNALKCLETHSQADNYALSLFAYANALGKQDEKATAHLEEMDKRAINKDYVKFWEASSGSKSVAVEIAGYYILARLKLENSAALEKIQPVVRWITQQRNSEGGFVSTQDTVVALQALALYATYMSKKPVDIALSVETDEMSKGFKVDESNKLVTQSLKISELPTTVDLVAYGEGCALVQFSLRYNVEKTINNKGLELNINSRRRGSRLCNLPSLGICMRYAVYKEKTNMAVLSVKLPSGFVADEWSLSLLANDDDVQLRRHEISENEVNLYFEEITNEAKCFEFNIKSAFDVEDIKPSIIRLYDYYQPERQVTKEFLIPSTCNTAALPDIPWLPLFNPLPTAAVQESTNEFMADSQEMLDIPDDEPTPKVLDSNSSSLEPLADLPSIEGLDEDLQTLEVIPEFSGNKSEENTSHLSEFVNVDQDLDFPDGLEGQMPVYVPAPVDSGLTTGLTTNDSHCDSGKLACNNGDCIQNDLVCNGVKDCSDGSDEIPCDSEELNCPICRNSFPENFTAIYCNSAFALKVMKRENSLKTVKIIQDMSFYVENTKLIKKFGELEYEEVCTCPQLQEKGKILFIVGSPVSLWESNEKKHKIRLTSSVYVLLIHQKQLNSFITEAKTTCADDP